MSSDLKIVATAANEFEAELISGLLTEAGIESNMELANTGIGAMGGRFGGGGARDIYVRAEDLERAKEALSEQQDAGEANGEDG
jgi:Putative prokaryotic signal transducing protein